MAVDETLICDDPTIVTDAVAEQLFASVTVNVYVPAVRLNVPVPTYGGVPPEALTVTVELPPQETGVALAEAVSVGGAVIVNDCVVAVQPFASVTVKEYVPALRTNVPVPVYGGAPPVAVTVTVDVLPLQRMGVALDEAVNPAGGCAMVTDVVAVQLFASDIVKENVPAERVNVPVPVYGGVPPEAVTVTVDVPPLQSIGVATTEMVHSGGSVIVTEVVLLQPFASVTTKSCLPAPRLNFPTPV